jgi:hypothetical protein
VRRGDQEGSVKLRMTPRERAVLDELRAECWQHFRLLGRVPNRNLDPVSKSDGFEIECWLWVTRKFITAFEAASSPKVVEPKKKGK